MWAEECRGRGAVREVLASAGRVDAPRVARWVLYHHGHELFAPADPEQRPTAEERERQRGEAALLLAQVCADGGTGVAEVLTRHFGFNRADARTVGRAAFLDACCAGRTAAAAWIADRFGPACVPTEDAAADDRRRALLSLCERADPIALRCLAERLGVTAADVRGCFALCAAAQAPGKAYFECARWLCEKFVLSANDVRAGEPHSNAFQVACGCGRRKLAQWLADMYQLTAGDVRAGECLALVLACESGNIRLLGWLTSHFALVAADVTPRVFAAACRRPSAEAARWLASHFGLTSPLLARGALAECCAVGYVESAQWLCDTFGLTVVDVRCDNCRALLVSCEGGHADAVCMLVQQFALTAADARACRALRACGTADAASVLTDSCALTADDARDSIAADCDAAVRAWLVSHFILQTDAVPPDGEAGCEYVALPSDDEGDDT
eukprot:TRINITY_DN1882_c0_g1_i1.p1 TRINITY_DN1882_c0_g1~~TRINITY_DN1882_c0_g1_i1.p1  ORF type:complete len:443 (+),score=77.29 TRINITY_DN1882_c0_g1_i1:145-1473(+)